MHKWAPIQYMGFWDVPLVFIVCHNGQTFLFDCPFEEELDDYSESYRVYTLPDLREEELPKDWTTLRSRAIRCLGDVSVSKVRFDATKRREIDTAVIDELTSLPTGR